MRRARGKGANKRRALSDGHETGHLVGDVPALLIAAAVLWYLSPSTRQTAVAA
jgi:hypothetical protein